LSISAGRLAATGILSKRRNEAIVAHREDMIARILNHMHARGSSLSLKAILSTSESGRSISDPRPSYLRDEKQQIRLPARDSEFRGGRRVPMENVEYS
jgi:hypothetical protein